MTRRRDTRSHCVTRRPLLFGALLVPLLAACDGGPAQAVLTSLLGEENVNGAPVSRRAYPPKSFVNFESPHVSPLAVTPDGARLLAVNTPDNRLEVFDLQGTLPVSAASIHVGVEPVSVRARTASEAWVVNHVSDSVSIVDLDARTVVRTLLPGDEPTDVAFASGRAFVVCSQINAVAVYELANLDAPPLMLAIEGEDPRALAVSPDGRSVFVAIFESGNLTTVLSGGAVADRAGPYGGATPPNVPDGFSPPLREGLPAAPKIGLIVRKELSTGRWLDSAGADWSSFVTWDLHDHDLAVIDAGDLSVRYVPHLMTLNMGLAALADGRVAVVGTEAQNELRFEPVLAAHFVRSKIALVDPAQASAAIYDLNPHLAGAYDAGVRTLPPQERAASLADPRGVTFASDGQTGYVTGLGSNNVAKIDAAGGRLGQVDVGAGPTGVWLDEPRGRLYVLNRFDATISTIDTAAFAELGRTAFFDPTPEEIRRGRPLLYDARLTSGLGVTACASCHVDGRMDQLAWDLGDPSAEVKAFNQACDDLLSGSADGGACEDFHPLKGPMTTQTLQGIIGLEPLHWRGDRENLAAFNPAFVGLLGNDRQLSAEEMRAFEAFLATLTFPPNPNRNPDNSLRREVALEEGQVGDAVRGETLFMTEPIDSGAPLVDREDVSPFVSGLLANSGPLFSCNRCHQAPTGTNQRVTPARDLNTAQGMKVPHLRNIHEKTGFSKKSRSSNRGFGFTHDGHIATVDEFLHLSNFDFGGGAAGDRKRFDVIAFVMSFSTDTHAGVGLQRTITLALAGDAEAQAALDLMLRLADAGEVGLVVHGLAAGAPRGWAYAGGGVFEGDRAGEAADAETLRLRAAASADFGPLTWTLVPRGSETRLGIDRDLDGRRDGE